MGRKSEKPRNDVRSALDVEMFTEEDTETKITDLVITKLTDLSAPACNHIIKYLLIQDLLNLRVSCITMFDMVIADQKTFLQKV